MSQLSGSAAGGYGNQALSTLGQYMNQGLNPNLTNLLNQQGQNLQRQREQSVGDIQAAMGRGGTAAMRTAGDNVGQLINQQGANILQTGMNAQQANAATRLGAAQAIPGATTGIYGAPSSLEMAFLNDIQKPYDMFNAQNQNQYYSNILGTVAPFMYQNGSYIGSPNQASQAAQIIGMLLGMGTNMFGGNVLPMAMNR